MTEDINTNNPETLLDLAKENTEQKTLTGDQSFKTPIQEIQTSPTQQPTKSKKILWIVLGVILLVLAGTGYFYYFYIYSAKLDLAKYKKGPDFTIVDTDVSGFFAAPDAVYYQKTDNKIYADYISLNKAKWGVSDPKGGELVSVSPLGDKGIVYYADDSADIKDAKGNYFNIDFEKNEVASIGGAGNTYENFMWAANDLFFTRNNNEILDFDFDFSKYQYNPDISNFKKIVDLKYPLISIVAKPVWQEFYLISDFSQNDKQNFVLTKYNIAEKKFTTIQEDVSSVMIGFSPSGKYYYLYDSVKLILSIYYTESNQLTKTIENVAINPLKISWDTDEKNIFFFTGKRQSQEGSIKRITEFSEIYFDFNKYNLDSDSSNLLINGKNTNLADPLDFVYLDSGKKLFIITSQNNNLYRTEIE